MNIPEKWYFCDLRFVIKNKYLSIEIKNRLKLRKNKQLNVFKIYLIFIEEIVLALCTKYSTLTT